MPSTIREAALEATVLLQAFVAGVASLQFYWFFDLNHNYHWTGYETRYIAPLLALALLLAVLAQLKLSSPNRKQTLQLEFTKTGLATLLWAWFQVSSWVLWGDRGAKVHRAVETVLSFVVTGLIFYSTLFVAWRRERRGGRISLRDEAGSLLPN
ncbi:hypothetical protein B2J93_8651 [Marssonina coronariae]|uniref:Uncharacterized protein n=1 Tax=Diplocarpon coronariae TaxID=2795749 RepID=A0A218YXK0_9HELO|nr:hypothetical protein B2J93_8651 [Marssonina coronariae]